MEPADIQALAQAFKDLQPNQQSVQAVSLKLPEFWPDDPEVWFARVEAQFATRGIQQDATRFDYIVSTLDNSTASEVKAVVLHPPNENKYDAIKCALLAAFSKSQAQKDAELLSLSGLGDRKPSALLRRIRSLNNDAETLRRALFLAQLPSDVRGVLAGQDIQDLDELVRAADRIIEARQFGSPHAVCGMKTVDNDFVDAPSVSGLRKRSQLLHAASNSPKKSSPTSSFVCHFHLTYGPEARKCRPGCLFAQMKSSSALLSSGNEVAGR